MSERIALALHWPASFKLSVFRSEEGQGVTEYGIAVGFVAVALAAVLVILGGDIQNFINAVGNALAGLPGSL